MAEDISVDFLAHRLDRLTTDVGSLRDDMRVNTAILLRLDNTRERHEALLTDMLTELRAIHQQAARMNDRIRKLEGAEDER